jgi:L-aspartate semialdehyde sulfurtransferase ferredoxin
MKSSKVVLGFPPDRVEEPVIHHLITRYGLRVNILRAAIDPGKRGHMVLELGGEDGAMQQGLDHLERIGVDVRPLAEEILHNEELCMSCSACIPHCTTGALALDRKTWHVHHHPERCVVCHSCMDACPYRAIEIADR